MKKYRIVSIAVAVMLLLPLYACISGKDSGDTGSGAGTGGAGITTQIPDSTTPTDAQELSPTPSLEKPTPSEDTPTQGATGSGTEKPGASAVSGDVVISFDYEKQSGSASNQYAVWIEDMDGNVVRTLYASRWTAKGGFKTRPDSIALWVGRAGLANMTNAEVDAVSGATPKSGPVSYTWDLTGAEGNTVPPGDYRFFVEGTLRWKNFVLYSGVITLGDSPVSVRAAAEYNYEADTRYAALTPDSGENDMIGSVKAVFTPSAH